MKMSSKLLAVILSNLVFLNNVYAKTPAKPTINNNTQIRIEYGCKRPNWQKQSKTFTTKYSNIIGLTIDNYDEDNEITIQDCLFSTRHLVLFNTSNIEPKIEIKKCKFNNEERMCCNVIEGEWNFKNNDNVSLVNNPAQIQIDHILPFSYIRLNMKDCRLTNKYYNYLPNLKPELASINLKKSNNLCSTNEECTHQKEICKKMAEKFNDVKLCDELNKIAN